MPGFLNNGKERTKWEPDDYELEMTTHWSFPKRGDKATHDAKWRGNLSSYIPRNIILKYSKLPSSTREQTVRFIFARAMQEIWILFQMRGIQN